MTEPDYDGIERTVAELQERLERFNYGLACFGVATTKDPGETLRMLAAAARGQIAERDEQIVTLKSLLETVQQTLGQMRNTDPRMVGDQKVQIMTMDSAVRRELIDRIAKTTSVKASHDEV